MRRKKTTRGQDTRVRRCDWSAISRPEWWWASSPASSASGAGFVIVPTLAVALAFSMRSAIGTSLAIITTTSALGVVVHLAAGRSLDLNVTVAMGAACVAGALLGARLSSLIPRKTLGRAFASLVVLVAGYLLVSAAFLGGPPGS